MTAPEIEGLEDLVEIGRGGFGVVFRARQVRLDRYVAVKLLSTQLLDDRSRVRFEREGRALGTLSGHPHVVGLYEFGITEASVPYLVLEYLPEGSYADRLSRTGPLPVDEATRVILQVAGALESAHRLGILHCDLKPENVLVGLLNEPKLGDFGIAQVEGAGTATSSVLASPAHAAPEIIDGHPATARSDIYGLGSTMYALLAGRPAFLRPDDASVFAIMARIATQPPPDLRGAGVPEPVWATLYWSMAKAPNDRPASALTFARQLNSARTAIGLSAVPIPVRDERSDPPAEPHRPPPDRVASVEPYTPPAPTVSPLANPDQPYPPRTPQPETAFSPPNRANPNETLATPAPVVAADGSHKRSRVALAAVLSGFVVLVVLGGLAAYLRNRTVQSSDSSNTSQVSPTTAPASSLPPPTSSGSSSPSSSTTRLSSTTSSTITTPKPQIEPSTGSPPPMPTGLDGYRASQPVVSTTVRVFQQETGGQLIDSFPSGMNHCAQTFWTLRWRTENPNVSVRGFRTAGGVTAQVGATPTGQTPVDAADGTIPNASISGSISGFFCTQPAFLFGTSTDPSNLVDVTIDYQVWDAAP